jgi:hypothetical protein
MSADISPEEQDILFENVQKEYSKLKPDDPRFIGIDLDRQEFWVNGHGFKIKSLGYTSKKEIRKINDLVDDLAKQLSELDSVKDIPKRIAILVDLDHAKEQVIDKMIPLMLNEMDGKPFNIKKWFDSDEFIKAGVWWDVVRDLYFFLRVSGTKEDTLRSMMQSSSDSSKTSTITNT